LNYKGFPTCQATPIRRESRERFTLPQSDFDLHPPKIRDGTLDSGKGCGLEKLQPVSDAADQMLRALMKDTRGSLRPSLSRRKGHGVSRELLKELLVRRDQFRVQFDRERNELAVVSRAVAVAHEFQNRA
jgi:hypothetical protein